MVNMALKLGRLSSNLLDIISELLENQKFVELVGSNKNYDSTAHTIQAQDIAPYGKNEKIYPFPFTENFDKRQGSSIHVYFPEVFFKNNGYANQAIVAIDVLIHKDLWLILDDGEKKIRAYAIAEEIVNSLSHKQIKGLGKVHLDRVQHLVMGRENQGLSILARFTEF